MKTRSHKAKVMGLAAAGALLLAAPVSRASEQELLDKIKQLEQRVAELEGKAVPPAGLPEKTAGFLGQTELSGFVSASYLYDFSKPGNNPTTPGVTPGASSSEVPLRTFDRQHNEFMLNKLKIALENPVAASGDEWDAGFRADVIVGQDADAIQSLGLFDDADGEYIDLEQAYVQMNLPVGNGVVVKLGKMVTLMGVEVIEEVANPNWSEGNQFLLVENFTSTGALLSYKWNDTFDSQLMLCNGWDVVKDNNNAKSFMGRLGIVPDNKTALSIVGYVGPEQTGDNTNLRSGINVVLNRKLTDKLNSYVQLDYGAEDKVVDPGTSEWYAAGLWLIYDFTDKIALAVRGDYLKDVDGTRTGAAGLIGAPTDADLVSFTATLNLKPVANLQVRPEIRWDKASDPLFAGQDERVTIGLGIAYLF